MLPFHFVDRQVQFIGVPAAITSLVVVSGAIVGGPRVGIALAFVSGAVFDTLVVTERWLAAGITTGAVLIVWVGVGLAVGMLGDRYRGQVARALAEAHKARDSLDRVLEAAPSFHARGSSPAVARAVCDAARSTFDCDLVALFAIEDERLRLLARSPYLSANDRERLLIEPSLELQQELSDYLLPRFVSDIRVPAGPRLPRAITTDPTQVSAIRAPVLLDGVPVALLAMSWSRAMPTPERSELAVVQRFAEHAAVALGQAQRSETQREIGQLYQRFQASLVPAIETSVPGISIAALYRPGEHRMLLGGDFIDTAMRPDGRLAAVIGDVTGHGPDAAALGSSLRAAWRALMLRGAPLGQALRTLNSLTLDESSRVERGDQGLGLLATVCIAEVDPDTRQARFAVAGHPPPLILGSAVFPLRHESGPMLGLDEDSRWPVARIVLPEHWGLFLYTDGIVEARRSPGDDARLGTKGLADRLAGMWNHGDLTQADLAALVDSIQEVQGGALPDDVALLLLAQAPPEQH